MYIPYALFFPPESKKILGSFYSFAPKHSRRRRAYNSKLRVYVGTPALKFTSAISGVAVVVKRSSNGLTRKVGRKLRSILRAVPTIQGGTLCKVRFDTNRNVTHLDLARNVCDWRACSNRSQLAVANFDPVFIWENWTHINLILGFSECSDP